MTKEEYRQLLIENSMKAHMPVQEPVTTFHIPEPQYVEPAICRVIPKEDE